MSAAENRQIVADAYAAFGQGDIGAVIDSLTDDVVWTNHAPQRHRLAVCSTVRTGSRLSSSE
jgi:ketosteroid isomerase-like protein